MKEIYSPARNDRKSIIIKKGTNSFNQTLELKEDFLGDKVNKEEPAFKRKKIKINHNDKRTQIRTYKRCNVTNIRKNDTITTQLNEIDEITDYYRAPNFNIEKDNEIIFLKGLNDMYKRKTISRKTAESIYSIKHKLKRQSKSRFSFLNQTDQPKHCHSSLISKEKPQKIINFTHGFSDHDQDFEEKSLSLKKVNKRLKKNNSLYNLYKNVKNEEKAEAFDISKIKEQNFFALVAINERFKKMGKSNSKLKEKMNELLIT